MDYEEELESYIATCPGDCVVVEDPNGDLRYEDWSTTQEPGFDKRTIVYDPQESELHCAPKPNNLALGEYYQMELERRTSPINQFYHYLESEEYKKDWMNRYCQNLEWYE